MSVDQENSRTHEGAAWAASRDAYLDLMKRCLTRYGDGEIFLAGPLEKPTWATDDSTTMQDLAEGKYAHQDADTMLGWYRLDNVRQCMERALEEGIPGDFVETGVWRGGTCMFMRAVLRAWDVRDRAVWVADSFNGFPPPDVEQYPADARFASPLAQQSLDAMPYSHSIGLAEVQSRFRRYGLLDDQVRFLPGYFRDTIPQSPIEQVAVLRLDGDLYESTDVVLRHLYDRLSVGGYCIIDDYSLDPCVRAVEDFRAERGITDPIEKIDWTGVYWRKTAA
ncbi:TylF/MycF/NovP-related O-methyltransferase [Amycolatopsis cihanbeyliensis]|uniref:O-methyltransferase n=1 Tax=Amycolatopsis cihanbeyliensis TaxID=1128664 RepID=A0A542DJC1_AMYCI|nr:TylF/MycF/NovP-related O-methyltransferase [Amycolatopsis cihanbeyliensis]TQJ03197.1 O-methyltransferase [Amycolatopsis cihanbeyliensis]WCB87242.1 EfrMIII [Amycolatopsis cihanbeyliensis]